MIDLSDRSHNNCDDYIRALEEERNKIHMFKRELPLCLQLVSQAIENLRQTASVQVEKTLMMANSSPVLAEFLPLKPTLSSSSDEQNSPTGRSDHKPDWLRSVQLWSQESDTNPKLESPKKVKKIGGAFQPFEREKVAQSGSRAVDTVTATSSTASTDSGGARSGHGDEMMKECKARKGNEEQSQSQALTDRKTRRCWSPELHRLFVRALDQLGGSHVATPKQIRELMKVNDLTNDEVKSHLQKYRLHNRRPSPPVKNNNNSNTEAPQIVVVGGIWVPPTDYAIAAAQPVDPPTVQNEIYAPVALHPSTNVRPQHKHDRENKKQILRSSTGPLAFDGRCVDDNNTNSVSPSSSSLSQTTTVSPQT